MPPNWTPQDIISLIKFINFIWRRVEKLSNPTLLSTIESKLQHLSENLEYLRRESEHLLKDPGKRREVGVLLGKLSVDLNVLDGMVRRIKSGGMEGNDGEFEELMGRLGDRMREMEGARSRNGKSGEGGFLHGVVESWHHHVHWADAVEVRYPNTKDGFYHVEENENAVIKVDMRRDEGFDDDCITVFVRFQDNGFEGKIPGKNIEVVAPKSTNLGDVKKAIREKIGVPICQLLLSHRGSMLDNDFTLQDCGLENESTLSGVIISKHLAEGSPRSSWFWANRS